MSKKRPGNLVIKQVESKGTVIQEEAGWTTSGSYHVGNLKVGKEFTSRCDEHATQVTPTDDVREFLPNDLEEIKLLGKGASGVVMLHKHLKQSRYFAVKIINIGGTVDSKMIQREVNSLDNSCPFLVQSFTAYIRDKRLHIVQEYMNKGSLEDVLRCHEKAIPENLTAKIAEQVLKGLTYLFNACDAGGKGRLHRDLKPANILINSEGQVKISDFGIATADTTKGHSTFVGTTTYMSPERIKGDRYSTQSDIWSAGLVFCECILGYYPYKNRTTFIQLLMEITKEQNFDFPSTTSENCKAFIFSCLKQNPEERPTAPQLLQHPYLKENANYTSADLANWLAGITIVPKEK